MRYLISVFLSIDIYSDAKQQGRQSDEKYPLSLPPRLLRADPLQIVSGLYKYPLSFHLLRTLRKKLSGVHVNTES